MKKKIIFFMDEEIEREVPKTKRNESKYNGKF